MDKLIFFIKKFGWFSPGFALIRIRGIFYPASREVVGAGFFKRKNMINQDTCFRTFSKRIETTNNLDEVERSLDRLFENGIFTISQYKRLDMKIAHKRIKQEELSCNMKIDKN